MNANTSPDITNDLIYSEDVSDTSENSHGTGKSLTIKNAFKAANITVDGTNVGINSTSPTEQLDVAGTVKATAFVGDGSGLTGVSGVGSVSDTAYGSGWDGDTTVAPSKNAVYDKIETLGSNSGWTHSGTNLYPSTTTDNVGIGTFDTTSSLTVKGNIDVSGDPYSKRNWYLKIPSPTDLSAVNSSCDQEVFSMIEFQGDLYIGMYAAQNGCQSSTIYKWDGKSLTNFKVFASTNHYQQTILSSFQGKLYVGVGGDNIGDSDIYVYDPIALTWTKSFEDTTHYRVHSMHEYNGKLYAGFGYSSGHGDVYEFDGNSWSISFNGVSTQYLVESMTIHNGKLYVGGGKGTSGDHAFIEQFDGTTWTSVYDPTGTGNNSVLGMLSYGGKLYASFQSAGCSTCSDVKSWDGNAWTTVYDNDNITIAHGPVIYNGRLYISTTPNSGGGQVLSYDGYNGNSGWTQVFQSSSGEQEAFYLYVFNGELLVGYGFDYLEANIYAYREQIGEQDSQQNRNLLNKLNVDNGVNNEVLYSNFYSINHSGILNTGNVGIGTPIPQTNLHVVGNAIISGLTSGECVQTTTGGLLTTTGSACGSGGVSGTVSSGTADRVAIYDSAGTTITSSSVITDNNTNIGIGTTGPRQKLEVNGTVLATAFSGNLTGNVTGNADTVTTNANLSGDVSSVGNTTTIGAGKVTEAMQVLADNTTQDVSTSKHGYAPKLPNDATKYLDGTGAYSVPSGGGSGGWTDGGTNVYNTTTTDNVGIGTTIPSSNLMIRGSTVNGLKVVNSASSGSSAGAGIQAHSDDNAAVVQGDRLGFYTFGGSADTGDTINNGAAITGFADGTFSSTSAPTEIRFETAPSGSTTRSARMYVKSDGNIGIGTANPQTTLQALGDTKIGNGTFSNTSANEDLYVEGNLEVDGTIYGDGSGISGLSSGGWTDGGTNVYTTTTTDAVAIGTTTPVSGSILTVNGTIAGGGSGPMAITNANVGIGTTTAGSLLTVGSTGQFTVDTSGNTRVGIGTTTAGTIVCVKSISGSTAQLGYCTGSLTNSICGTCN